MFSVCMLTARQHTALISMRRTQPAVRVLCLRVPVRLEGQGFGERTGGSTQGSTGPSLWSPAWQDSVRPTAGPRARQGPASAASGLGSGGYIFGVCSGVENHTTLCLMPALVPPLNMHVLGLSTLVHLVRGTACVAAARWNAPLNTLLLLLLLLLLAHAPTSA
jgi:hypothetical protein